MLPKLTRSNKMGLDFTREAELRTELYTDLYLWARYPMAGTQPK